jgi:hypothetical protein
MDDALALFLVRLGARLSLPLEEGLQPQALFERGIFAARKPISYSLSRYLKHSRDLCAAPILGGIYPSLKLGYQLLGLFLRHTFVFEVYPTSRASVFGGAQF